MSKKRELIDIASQLQSIVDRLLECSKEDSEDEDSDEYEKPKSNPARLGMIATIIKKKLEK